MFLSLLEQGETVIGWMSHPTHHTHKLRIFRNQTHTYANTLMVTRLHTGCRLLSQSSSNLHRCPLCHVSSSSDNWSLLVHVLFWLQVYNNHWSTGASNTALHFRSMDNKMVGLSLPLSLSLSLSFTRTCTVRPPNKGHIAWE